MSKSLKTLQALSKIGKVFSNIIFIFSMIGAIISVIAVTTMASMQKLEIEGQTVVDAVESTGTNFVTMVFLLIAIGITCTAIAVLSKLAVNYFTNELDDGTPFTYAGAKELLRLGILSIAIPAATSTVIGIAFIITKYFWPALSDEIMIGEPISISFGIMLIIMSLVFKHGAELEEKLKIDL
jgi:hypothetical protein